jgi:hypothetical protein
MRLNDVFTSDYLRVEDLKKRRRTFTIEDIAIEKIGDDKKPVISFEGQDKKLVLNKTNAMTICSLLDTDEMDDWIGRKITLRPDQTTYQGKAVPCIRVDLELPEDEPKPRPVNRAAGERGYVERPDDGSMPADEIPF